MQTFTQTELRWIVNAIERRATESIMEAREEENSYFQAVLRKHGENLNSIALRLRTAIEQGDRRIKIE